MHGIFIYAAHFITGKLNILDVIMLTGKGNKGYNQYFQDIACVIKIVTSALCFFLNFQLLGHLLVVAKNVAKQESLSEGYRVGKLLDYHIE